MREFLAVAWICLFAGLLTFSGSSPAATHYGGLLDHAAEYLVALFTLTLTGVTGLLWWSTRDLVKGAEDTAQRQLRAYVTLVSGGVQLRDLLEGGLGITVTVQLRNSGQTPGYKFTTWHGRPEILAPDATPFTPPTPISERTGTSIIGAGADVWLNWTFPCDAAVLRDIASGKKHVFFWGGANFVDAFGRDRYFIFRSKSGTGVFFSAGHGLPLQPHTLGYEAN